MRKLILRHCIDFLFVARITRWHWAHNAGPFICPTQSLVFLWSRISSLGANLLQTQVLSNLLEKLNLIKQLSLRLFSVSFIQSFIDFSSFSSHLNSFRNWARVVRTKENLLYMLFFNQIKCWFLLIHLFKFISILL